MGRNKNSNFTQISNFRELVEKYKSYNENVAFKYKQKGRIVEITYKKYVEDVRALGTAILNLGVEKVAIIGNNRYEWCVSYMATTTSGKVIVPLDKALTDKEIVKLIKRSGAQAVIFDEKYQNAIEECDLEYKICMDELIKDGIVRYGDLIGQGYDLLKRDVDTYDKVKIDNNQMAVLLFTSGTTNEPKGVKLSQYNLCSQVSVLWTHQPIYEDDTLLSFLPIHHTFESTITFLYGTYCGATIAFCEGLKYIAQNLKDYKVTVFVAVPLVLETMYKKIQKGIADSGKKDAIDKLKKVSNALLKMHIDVRKALFKPVLKQFDEYLRVVLYGAAPMDRETILGYNELGIELTQGYGLTEASPVIATETYKLKRPGSIGIPLPNVKVKIKDPNEEGIGELLAQGPNIMLGYYENEEATKKAIDDDGWLHTGDFAYIDKDGFIFITGRQSDIIVLRNGKNIYPQELEFLINKLPYVEESIVYSRNKTKTDTVLCAKIVYDKEKIQKQFGKQKDYQEFVWKDIKELNKELPTYKHIKEIILTDTPLEKTTTQKVKRYVEIKKTEKQLS